MLHVETAKTQPAPSGRAASPASGADPMQLYRHSLRESWGHAIIAWDRPTKRAYQFEDGKMRIIKSGYYALMRPAHVDVEQARRLADRLLRQAGISRARRVIKRQAKQKGKTVLTLERQLSAFRMLYPKGFGDEWRFQQRGIDANKTLKRHRDAHVATARESFAHDEMRRLIDSGQSDEIIERWIKLLGSVDLAASKDTASLERLGPVERENAARALFQLLHDPEDKAQHLDTLGRVARGLSWAAATTPLALTHPASHICVRPAALKKQAKWMAPALEHQDRLSAALYRDYLEMVGRVRERLERAELRPEDLLDVCDFIRISALPSTLKKLA